MQSQKMPTKLVKKFLLYYLVIIRISQFLSAEKHKHVKIIFAIWLSLFSWTKIEFNKEKRHLIGDHIFAEERCPGVYKCAIMDDDNEEGEN